MDVRGTGADAGVTSVDKIGRLSSWSVEPSDTRSSLSMAYPIPSSMELARTLTGAAGVTSAVRRTLRRRLSTGEKS
jgi:hypothetical protein